MMQFDCLVEGTVTCDAESGATNRSGRPFVTFRLDHQQGHHNATGTWRNTVRVPYEITCWDRRVMPTLLNIRKGQRVLVHATRFSVLTDNRTGEPRFTLTPDVVHTVTDTRAPHTFQCLVTGDVTTSAQSRTIGNDQRPLVTFRIDNQQGYHDNKGRWHDTLRQAFQVTCFDEHLMPALRGIRRGEQVLVHANRLNILADAGTGEDLFNLTPNYVRILAAPAPQRTRQRNGHTVLTPHGEEVDAAAWPDVVTDLELVHHS